MKSVDTIHRAASWTDSASYRSSPSRFIDSLWWYVRPKQIDLTLASWSNYVRYKQIDLTLASWSNCLFFPSDRTFVRNRTILLHYMGALGLGMVGTRPCMMYVLTRANWSRWFGSSYLGCWTCGRRADEVGRTATRRYGGIPARSRREGEIVPHGVCVRSVERRDGGGLDRVGRLFVLLNPARSTEQQHGGRVVVRRTYRSCTRL